MCEPEYVCIKITNIPQEFIEECKLAVAGPDHIG